MGCKKIIQEKSDLYHPNSYGLYMDALPTEETLSTYSNSLVILHDIMYNVVSDPNMMTVFTIRIAIIDIFMTNSIFHQGKAACKTFLNTGCMIIFKNIRDRHKIKTLAIHVPRKLVIFQDSVLKGYSLILS